MTVLSTTTLSRHIGHFSIGMIAGLISVYFPRASTAVATNGTVNYLAVYDVSLLVNACLFALIIGIVVAFFAANADKTAREVFMMSLGVPALLAGAVSTNDVAGGFRADVEVLALQNENTTEQYQELEGQIFEELGVTVEPLPAHPPGLNPGDVEGSLRGKSKLNLAWLPGIAAHAASEIEFNEKPIRKSTGLPISFYFLRIDTVPTKVEAEKIKKEYETIFPKVTAVESGDQFIILSDPNPLPTPEVLTQISMMLETKGTRPTLIPWATLAGIEVEVNHDRELKDKAQQAANILRRYQAEVDLDSHPSSIANTERLKGKIFYYVKSQQRQAQLIKHLLHDIADLTVEEGRSGFSRDIRVWIN